MPSRPRLSPSSCPLRITWTRKLTVYLVALRGSNCARIIFTCALPMLIQHVTCCTFCSLTRAQRTQWQLDVLLSQSLCGQRESSVASFLMNRLMFGYYSCTGVMGTGSSQNRNLKIRVSSFSGIPRYIIVTKCYILCPVKL